jgi:Mce-associated membrane protein
VEDQSTDSGDLTADAATASAPQGKAARNRHRLPRQRSQSEPLAEAPEVSDVPEAPTVADVPEVVDPAESTAEPKQRRRKRWRRKGTVAEIEADTETGSADDADAAEPGPEPVLVPHRTAGRALKVAAVIAGLLFIAAGAFAGATIQPYLSDRATVHTKFEIAETAANAITTLWTYTPDDMDRLPERSAKYLGGDFAVDYKRYIDAIVAPNKQAQVSNNTQVLGAAVESLTPTEATAIVYTNSVATSPVTKGIPSLRYLSYRLKMKPQGERWLITEMVAVTKLDLTPRL